MSEANKLKLLVSNFESTMERKELEKLLEDKVIKGELSCGLYDTGLMYVRVFLGGEDMDDVCFEWFDSAQTLDGLIDC